MAFLSMILTFPLLYISYEKQHESERLYIGKLALLWVLCQLYVSINMKFKVPIGIVLSSIIVYYEKINKKSKLISVIVGCISYMSSNLVYLLYKI
jgi:branched-subunit amino acid transport protein AzlD